ncbi:MAG: glycosyltransferase [Chloroflexales bacterium]|nr:glycosyltransferase [Chloroflexales bacterium]
MVAISIVASGSRGDVQPYIALGKGLKAAGYDVRILASDDFDSLVASAGLEFCSTGESVERMLQNDEWRKVKESGNFLMILSRMRVAMKREAAQIAQRMTTLLAGSDLIVTGMAGISVFSIADMLKIPVIQAYVVPFTPTRAFPSPLFPKLPWGGVLNRLSFHLMQQVFWQGLKVSDVVTRRELGMPPAPFWGPFRALSQAQAPVLYGYSPHVLPRPNDWAANYHVTGYWFLDEPSGWAPPADLANFLNAGEPPVYIGFGSMGSRNPEAAGQLALEALARAGQRGALASGWGGLSHSNLPETVHMISSIPHSWLFPRMAAVVHHGGAGTTAAGLRAGVPAVIVPFMGDQAFWGRRVADLGVGPAPITRKKLTSTQLAEAITQAVSDTAMCQRAADLGRKIRAEDGAGQAISLIQRLSMQRASAHNSVIAEAQTR